MSHSPSQHPPGRRRRPAWLPKDRARVRDLDVPLGKYEPGRFNAITDVGGVRVGHSTVLRGEPGRGAVRTGVTAILPWGGNIFHERVVGGGFVLNGAGEVSGLTQVLEWGLVETPILLTNTLSVGTVSAAAARHMLLKHPGIGDEHDVIIPLVGECDDSWLNDIAGQHVTEQHVFEALDGARTGSVPLGNVGGGTGMVTFDFKGGIGSASRVLPQSMGGFVIGVLVMSNFGRREDLRVAGYPLGDRLESRFGDQLRRRVSYGSCIAVVATNAPLLTHQINRLCKRVALGLGRAGSYAAHGSGEIVLGFSTTNRVPRESKRRMLYRVEVLMDTHMDPLYDATVECTEEAVLDALCTATEMTGAGGHHCPALPLDAVREAAERMSR